MPAAPAYHEGVLCLDGVEISTRGGHYIAVDLPVAPYPLGGDARDVICQTAKEVHADLIVMGTHGRRGVTRALLGSVTENVVRQAPCPVLTVRPHTTHIHDEAAA